MYNHIDTARKMEGDHGPLANHKLVERPQYYPRYAPIYVYVILHTE